MNGQYVFVPLIGREGGKPPIYLVAYRRGSNIPVGVYYRMSLDEPPVFHGPMFKED